jgi:hypothetical protein
MASVTESGIGEVRAGGQVAVELYAVSIVGFLVRDW